MKNFMYLLSFNNFQTAFESIKACFLRFELQGVEYYEILTTYNGKTEKYVSEQKELCEYWISYFDCYRTYESIETVEQIRRFLEFIEAEDIDTIIQCSNMELSSKAKVMLRQYRNLVEYHNSFCMLIEFVHRYFHALIDVNKHEKNSEDLLAELTAADQILREKLKILLYKSQTYYEYVRDCLSMTTEDRMTVSTGFFVAMYEKYLVEIGESKKRSAISDFTDSNDWLEISQKYLVSAQLDIEREDKPYCTCSDYDFHMQFSIGVNHFIQNNMIFKMCPVCFRFFATKSMLLTGYCNKVFKDGKKCREIGSRDKYLHNLKTNPINTSYEKTFSRLYSRFRRKSITEEECKFKELRALRDEYRKRYEITENFTLKQEILQKFNTAVQQLYGE